MAIRAKAESKVVIDGKPYIVSIIDNPTIEDVVETEARIYAAEVMNNTPREDRRVERPIRDFLIRLGVDR